MKFNEKLRRIEEKNNTLVCVGLDIDKDLMPSFLFDKTTDPYLMFNNEIINQTADLVCAYKINLAFYEVLGQEGFKTLIETIQLIPKDIPIILDGKRNDIGNTAKKYAITLFDILQGDATTITPYLGSDGIIPFTNYQDKGVFILCRTSNQSAPDLQNYPKNGTPLYEHVAHQIVHWNANENCGAVIGATYPKELQRIRTILGEQIPILIPGVGKQGGDLSKAVEYGVNSQGKQAIINSSRSILYAGNNSSYGLKARKATQQLQETINNYR